jgi:ATPase subunit of ABC transporter with duplicated ATPase domains
MMLSGANALILDEPTNHLDLESITSLNNGLMAFSEVALFASHDHQIVSTVANRIVEITADGIIDVMMDFDEYLAMKEASLSEDEGLPEEDNEYIDRQAA